MHRLSGAVLNWQGGRSPVTVPLSSLPVLSEDDVTALFAAFKDALGLKGEIGGAPRKIRQKRRPEDLAPPMRRQSWIC